jgi:hypothetical protein
MEESAEGPSSRTHCGRRRVSTLGVAASAASSAGGDTRYAPRRLRLCSAGRGPLAATAAAAGSPKPRPQKPRSSRSSLQRRVRRDEGVALWQLGCWRSWEPRGRNDWRTETDPLWLAQCCVHWRARWCACMHAAWSAPVRASRLEALHHGCLIHLSAVWQHHL